MAGIAFFAVRGFVVAGSADNGQKPTITKDVEVGWSPRWLSDEGVQFPFSDAFEGMAAAVLEFDSGAGDEILDGA